MPTRPTARSTEFSLALINSMCALVIGMGYGTELGLSTASGSYLIFYETNLFRLAVAALFGLLLAGAYRLRLRRLTAQMNARLDERV
jgi:hypothetical protein